MLKLRTVEGGGMVCNVLDVQMWGSSGIVEAGITEAKAFHLQCHCFES